MRRSTSGCGTAVRVELLFRGEIDHFHPLLQMTGQDLTPRWPFPAWGATKRRFLFRVFAVLFCRGGQAILILGKHDLFHHQLRFIAGAVALGAVEALEQGLLFQFQAADFLVAPGYLLFEDLDPGGHELHLPFELLNLFCQRSHLLGGVMK